VALLVAAGRAEAARHDEVGLVQVDRGVHAVEGLDGEVE